MRGMRRAALALIALAAPAAAQEEPVGPCSPYRAADGDIPSEMPGCAGRRRPVPGSLADEMAFRRTRAGRRADPDAGFADDDGPSRPPKRRRNPSR